MAYLTKRLTLLSYLVMFMLVLAQLFGRSSWFLELFSHYSFHAVPLLLLTALLTSKRVRWLCIVSAIFLSVWAITPLNWLKTMQNSTDTAHAARIVMANVNIANPQPIQDLAKLTDYQPDVLVLIEAGGAWQPALTKLAKSYPFGCQHMEHSPFALSVFSKQPLASCSVEFIQDLAYIRLQTQKNQILYALHPPPPINKTLAQARNTYLMHTANAIHKETLPTLVMGDLNISAFSPVFRDFVDTAHLKQPLPRFYPSWFPLYLPIDQLLVKNMPTRVSVQLLARNHSDHHGLMIDTL